MPVHHVAIRLQARLTVILLHGGNRAGFLRKFVGRGCRRHGRCHVPIRGRDASPGTDAARCLRGNQVVHQRHHGRESPRCFIGIGGVDSTLRGLASPNEQGVQFDDLSRCETMGITSLERRCPFFIASHRSRLRVKFEEELQECA